MPRRRDKDFVTFNDGVLDVCKVQGRKIVDTKLSGIRFGTQTVGIKRFYQAKIISSQIDEVVAVPQDLKISTMDVCIIRGIQYKIIQVQNKYDKSPACLFLSLEKIVTLYEDIR
jgi:hypothetical protein